jgi:hypothetical protein
LFQGFNLAMGSRYFCWEAFQEKRGFLFFPTGIIERPAAMKIIATDPGEAKWFGFLLPRAAIITKNIAASAGRTT